MPMAQVRKSSAINFNQNFKHTDNDNGSGGDL